MYRACLVLMMVVCMAIWPFSSSGKAEDGGRASVRALNERIDSLERKIKRLESEISQLESRKVGAEAGADGAPPEQASAALGKGPCPGEWRKIGGGWVCSDPNAK